jgi:Ca2+-binding EF-hand superfamily protein
VVFDRDKTGFITSGDLYSVMEILGQMVNKEQLSAIFKEADLDGDGVINCMCSLRSSISQQH